MTIEGGSRFTWTSGSTVIDYTVAHGEDLTEFQLNIRDALSIGFQPYGPMCVNNDPSGIECFYQAMVKYNV